ncbi:hypothetical protein KR215_008815, partial [Drosophila sulfurigaster]
MWVTGLITLTGSYNCNNNNNNNNSNNQTKNNNNNATSESNVKRFAQFFSCWSVINTLTFLMNDFRFKSLYRATKSTTTNTSTLNKTILTTTTTIEDSIKKPKKSRRSIKTKKSSTTTTSATTTSSAFDNSNNNNPRTYNNSSKSNKVFLHYIPRDPRLRIFNRTATLNKHLLFSHPPRRTLSELNITEDLCNYGEVIGG